MRSKSAGQDAWVQDAWVQDACVQDEGSGRAAGRGVVVTMFEDGERRRIGVNLSKRPGPSRLPGYAAEEGRRARLLARCHQQTQGHNEEPGQIA